MFSSHRVRTRRTLLAILVGSLLMTTAPAAQTAGVREVSASDRSVISLQTRLRYTTMIVLPDGEEILDVICGDRDFWVISATANIAHVKPAKSGTETNLNLITARGTIYSFLLSEKAGAGSPDLKVYVNGDATNTSRQKYYSSADVERLQADVTEAHAAAERAERRATEAIAADRQQYPTRLQFVYGTPKYERPFLIRAMWHDGQFTYVKSDATELPALYEVQDGAPAVVNFQVQSEGTYIVPKVLDRGYLTIGKARFEFAQQRR